MIWYLGSDPIQKSQSCAVPLGIQGENGALEYTADVSDWLAIWPSGVVSLILQAADGSDPYIADTSIDRDTGIVTWHITGNDTATVGNGKGELRLVDGETIKKSYMFPTYVAPGITTEPGDPPTPTPSWINDMLEVASDIQTVIDDAEAARDAAQAAQAAAETAQGAAETARAGAEAAQAAAASSETNAAASEAAAAGYADAAETSADRAEQAAANAGYMDVYIDDNGHLIYERTDQVDVDFDLTNGRLIAEWL